MSRYRVQLVPQGAIPHALNIDVRLTPLGVPPPAEGPAAIVPPPPPCVPECLSINVIGWMSAAGEPTAFSGTNEFPIPMDGGPWTAQLFVNEVTPSNPPLCGNTLTWVFTGDLALDIDFSVGYAANNLWLFGFKGCDPPYVGNLTIQPQLDGEDFCDPLTFSFSGEGGGCDGGGSTCCFNSEVYGDICANGMNLGSSFPSIDFTDIGSNAGGPALYWTIVNVGTPVGLDPTISTSDGTTYTVSYDGVTDIFGANWICTPYLDVDLTMPYCDGQSFVIVGIS